MEDTASDLPRIAKVLECFLMGLEAVDRQRLVENAGQLMVKLGHSDFAQESNG
ncbi:hypothetical protein [Actinomadura sp. DC4]|uniref:hypothetical protein n=1 Tax=Actinomadura sp. DC4 TaxID=3055069 RepID=UPI0025B1E351|nr:hypothetical protein [Actinomadura sp. DC4]MDN3351346.1 hypothetical protein [Actinomadura sp. DC4]